MVMAAAATPACVSTPHAIQVGVVFGDSWTLGPVALTNEETSVLRAVALATLRKAYGGFAVDFEERADRERVIRLERFLFRPGSTAIGSRVSIVNLDAIHLTALAVTGCHDIVACAAYPRAMLVDALGRGIGATAAHELGHQAGLLFVRDSNCDVCYDGASSKSRAHFFGEKHWSNEALVIMNRVLRRS
jgi:hypothetical protein